jgi:ABC-type multidrug transport system fused ATPase/permease subunit
MVLEKGKIVEFDDKEKLLNNSSSKFKAMYDKSLKQVDK